MTSCPNCSKTLYSDQALRQHCVDTHGRHLCTICNKTVATSKGLRQHTESVHGHEPTKCSRKKFVTQRHSHNDPFPGIEGYWISREKFYGTKSFGYFECSHCSKEWFSAHAHKRFKQGCQDCEQMAFPCCLWVNTGEQDHSRKHDDDDGPHDRARCEACRKGCCLE